MRAYEELLAARKSELDAHLTLITELNAAAIARQGIANLRVVENEHVEILKSGFLVHLYNVIEAVMDLILDEIAAAAVIHSPRRWQKAVRTEWVRARAGIERDLESGKRLERTMSILDDILSERVGVEFRVRRDGNWANEEIDRISQRLGCPLNISSNVANAACTVAFQDNLPPMKYVRHKRNRLAHGNETFGSGASLLSPNDLGRLRDPVIDYMSAVVISYTQYLDGEAFLHQNAAP